MALYRALTTISAATGNPDDVTTNTMHVDANLPADLAGFQAELETFYGAVAPWLSDLLDNAGIVTEYYQLSDPEPRVPVRRDVWSAPSFGSLGLLPAECAIVLSFQAARVSGLPQARRRNRIYLGPIDREAVSAVDGSVSSVTVSDIETAAAAFLVASIGQPDWKWAVYSPTDGIGHDVAGGWVDNAWDTQRRRGREATARNVFP